MYGTGAYRYKYKYCTQTVLTLMCTNNYYARLKGHTVLVRTVPVGYW
jgi:hypothetical protein